MYLKQKIEYLNFKVQNKTKLYLILSQNSINSKAKYENKFIQNNYGSFNKNSLKREEDNLLILSHP